MNVDRQHELECDGWRHFEERELWELREHHGVTREEPVRAGLMPCDVCQPGRVAVWVVFGAPLTLQDQRDLVNDREARAVYYRAQGEWPKRPVKRQGVTVMERTPWSNESTPTAEGRAVTTGPDPRTGEKEDTLDWDE